MVNSLFVEAIEMAKKEPIDEQAAWDMEDANAKRKALAETAKRLLAAKSAYNAAKKVVARAKKKHDKFTRVCISRTTEAAWPVEMIVVANNAMEEAAVDLAQAERDEEKAKGAYFVLKDLWDCLVYGVGRRGDRESTRNEQDAGLFKDFSEYDEKEG
jgi:hypothetical protein